MDPKLRKYLSERRGKSRDYNDPRYIRFRNGVKARDKYRCQMPGCGQSKRHYLVVHHIKMWAEYPALRYHVLNGITLCRACHKRVTGQERRYETLFGNIVNQNTKKIK